MAAALLDQIEQDALDSTTNLADALRKCIALREPRWQRGAKGMG